eukprot:1073414-Prymnesium_polylepis.2
MTLVTLWYASSLWRSPPAAPAAPASASTSGADATLDDAVRASADALSSARRSCSRTPSALFVELRHARRVQRTAVGSSCASDVASEHGGCERAVGVVCTQGARAARSRGAHELWDAPHLGALQQLDVARRHDSSVAVESAATRSVNRPRPASLVGVDLGCGACSGLCWRAWASRSLMLIVAAR